MKRRLIITRKIYCILAIFAIFNIAFFPLRVFGAEYVMESFALGITGGQLSSGGDYSAKGALAQWHLPSNINMGAGEYANRTGFYNPPHFTYQKGLPVQISFASGNLELSLPANSIGKNVFDITINKNVISEPITADSSKINNANAKMENNRGQWSALYSGNISEIAIFDEQDFWEKPFLSKGVLAMNYKDSDSDGILDGSNPSVRIDTLKPWILDSEYSMWVKMPDAYSDFVSKKIIVPLQISGVYSLLGTIGESVKDVYVFPAPFRPNGPKAGIGPGKTGTVEAGITFSDLPQKGKIEIYTIDGRLVKKIAIPDSLPAPYTVKWDVKTASGNKAASGVYIWRVVSGSNSKTGKLMVIW